MAGGAGIAVLVCVAACGRTGFAPIATDGAAADGAIADGADGSDGAIDAAVGALTVASAAQPNGDVNLTSEGTLDWAHWGFSSATSFDRKVGGTAISDVVVIGAAMQTQITSTAVTATWSDGTPDAAASQTGLSTGIRSPGGLQLTATAGTTPHTLRLYVGGVNSRGKLDVRLSDGSAPNFTNDQFSSNATYHALYTIAYRAGSDGQRLVITWADEADGQGGACVATTCFEELISVTLQ